MQLFRLIYISSATHTMTRPETLAWLTSARAHNAKRDITGILLYKDGAFMQMLEGTELAVRALYARIKTDPRHEGVVLVAQEAINTREFSEWSMAFRDLNLSAAAGPAGYSDFLNITFHNIAFWKQPNRCQEMMLTLRAGLA